MIRRVFKRWFVTISVSIRQGVLRTDLQKESSQGDESCLIVPGRLSVAALLSQDELMTLVRSAPHRYKIFQVPKLSTRSVSDARSAGQGSEGPAVLPVMKHILSNFEIHSSGESVLSTSVDRGQCKPPHACGKFLLKMDFENFFDPR